MVSNAITSASLGHPWMMFVDGENFTIRAQEVASSTGRVLIPGQHYLKDTHFWFPGQGLSGDRKLAFGRLNLALRSFRSYFYTAVQGDDIKLDDVREALLALAFSPKVFRKPKGGRSKGVDVSLTTDVLAHAQQGSYQACVLVAGDGDYVPLIQEVRRLGRNVFVAFFKNNGLSPELRLEADDFLDLTDLLLKQGTQEKAPEALHGPR
ncbi:MAG: NYN domain-containing protein [Acidobacteria bacterium]|nr:NYN domain-containing protein [Acidobacteriota bacterium]